MKRLANAAERALFPGGNGGVKRRIGGDHDNHRLRIHLQKFFERAQAADARHGNVEQHGVVGAAAVSFQALFAGLGQIDTITVGREQRLQNLAHDLFVIDDEY